MRPPVFHGRFIGIRQGGTRSAGRSYPYSRVTEDRNDRVGDGVPRGIRRSRRPRSRDAKSLNNFYIAHSGWERVVSRLPLFTVLGVAVAGERTLSLARAEEEFLKGN